MPRVKAYRTKTGKLVRAHSRGTVSIGSLRKRTARQSPSMKLRHSSGGRPPQWLQRAFTDWNERKIYMGNNGQLRYYQHASPKGVRGQVTPYSGKVKRLYKLGTRDSLSMSFHHRAGRFGGQAPLSPSVWLC